MFGRSSQNIANFLVSLTSEHLLALAALIEDGKVTPVIDRTFALRDTAQAIDHVGQGHTRGKTVITV